MGQRVGITAAQIALSTCGTHRKGATLGVITALLVASIGDEIARCAPAPPPRKERAVGS